MPGDQRPEIRGGPQALTCREQAGCGQQPVASLPAAVAGRCAGEGGKRLVVLVTSPGRGERQVPPCPKEYGELLRRFLFRPGVISVGGCHVIAVPAQQPGNVRGLEGDAYDGVFGLGGLADPGQFTCADPAGLQPGGAAAAQADRTETA